MADAHPLGPYVRRFLLEDVIVDRNLSINTQRSYRDAIRLLFGFLAERHGTDPTCVTVEHVTEDIVRSFLTYLEQERGNCVASRNQRLAALHSLFRFVGRQAPELIEHAARIQGIPMRRTAPPTIPYLEKEEIDTMLATPDRRRPQARRDYALLLFLYNTGARADEAAKMTVGALDLGATPSVRILGKGGKTRHCPLWSHTADVLRKLLGRRLDGSPDAPVFLNVRGEQITRYGVHDLVQRTASRAAVSTPSLRSKQVSPHTIRHTTAVHLLRAGVDINTIRAWLGHVSLETTNRYAQVDLQMKAKALQTCAVTQPNGANDDMTDWRKDRDLMAFLTSL